MYYTVCLYSLPDSQEVEGSNRGWECCSTYFAGTLPRVVSAVLFVFVYMVLVWGVRKGDTELIMAVCYYLCALWRDSSMGVLYMTIWFSRG